MAKKWTNEEAIFIKENWQTLTLEKISKRLGRTPLAIKTKAKSLHLTTNTIKGSLDGLPIDELASTLDTETQEIKRWIKKCGLPIKEKHISKTHSIKYINLDSFWKWAEVNKQLLYFKGLSKHALGAEPYWVFKKRKDDIEMWSSKDSMLLQEMLEDGFKKSEIANFFQCELIDVEKEWIYIKRRNNSL